MDNTSIKECLEHALESKNKDHKELVLLFEKVLALDPDNVKANFEIGKLFFKLGNYSKVIFHHEKSESLVGENNQCRVILSKAYLKNKEKDKAEKYMRRSVELNENSSKYIALLALQLCREESNSEEGILLYERLLKITDTLKFRIQFSSALLKVAKPLRIIEMLSPYVNEKPAELAFYLNLSGALMMVQRYKEALGILIKAPTNHSDNLQLISKLADVHNAVGEHTLAAAYYKKKIEIEPNKTVNTRFHTNSLQRSGFFNEADSRKLFYAKNQHQHQHQQTVLSSEQEKVLAELSDKGYAITSFLMEKRLSYGKLPMTLFKAFVAEVMWLSK
ncbi:tetratricopeptide repeat protein [Thalassotalea piscium]